MDDPISDPFIGQNYWKLDPPRPVIAIPATMTDSLRGRRVLIGLPGIGWRSDLRADEKTIKGSRTYVPIMSESEWYRSESEKIEVFAALVPIDRVWVEDLGIASPSNLIQEAQPHLVSLDAPPRRLPTLAERAISLMGRRAIRLLEDGVEQRDLRVATELYTGEDGNICARVAKELEWYNWSWSGHVPQTLEVHAKLLWIE
ncbi:hypothetical protein [Actinoplanes regularis]|uniref:hypothetical protein n=1 Tax=Actinoplanes regularis TaxID=52697 RepID=UPI000B77BCD4|nr:hypothetical protein [Actinoplanes regularis]